MKLSTRVKLIVVLSVVIVMLASFAYAAFNLFSKEPELSATDWIEAKGRNIDDLLRGQGIETLPHLAAEEGRIDVLELLYEIYPASITEFSEIYPFDIGVEDTGITDSSAPIHFAAYHGQVEVMKWLMEHNVDIKTETTRYRLRPIHFAGEGEQKEAMWWLIEQSSDINTSAIIDWMKTNGLDIFGSVDGKPLAHVAAEEGRIDVLEFLYEQDSWSIINEIRTYRDNDGNLIGPEEYIGWAPIHFAAFRGQVEVMKWLMEQDVDIRTRVGHGSRSYSWLPIHCAAFGGQVEAMKWLIEQGVHINEMADNAWPNGGTPIHIAAYAGQVEAMKWLIEQGADLRAEYRYRTTPIYSAARGGSVEAMKFLKEMGVEFSSTIICTPAEEGHIEAMEWLKEQGADVNAAVGGIWPPMHYAAINGQVEAMKWLKDQGASVTVKMNGASLMFCAAEYGHLEVMKWLKDQGVDINEEGNLNWSIITQANARGSIN